MIKLLVSDIRIHIIPFRRVGVQGIRFKRIVIACSENSIRIMEGWQYAYQERRPCIRIIPITIMEDKGEQSTLQPDNSITMMEGKDNRLTLHSALGQIHNDHGRQRQPFALVFG